MRVGTENDSNTTKVLTNFKPITSIQYSAILRHITHSSHIFSAPRGLGKTNVGVAQA